MSENNAKTPRVLTEEDVARIMALPLRTFQFAGVARKGRFDDVNGIFYLVNEDGSLSGKIARTVRKDQPPETAPATSLDSHHVDAETAAPEDFKAESGEPALSVTSNRRKKEVMPSPMAAAHTGSAGTDHKGNRNRFILVATAVIITAIIFAVIASTLGGAKPAPSPGAISSVPAASEALPGSTAGTVQIIQVTKALIPGDKISEKSVQATTISVETYNQVFLDGSSLYQWSHLESLLGSYVISYIPQGQYLTYNNVASVYTQPQNPWQSEQSGCTYVTIPLVEGLLSHPDLSYGSVVDLTIVRRSVKEVDTPPTDEPAESKDSEVPGLDHTTSVQQSYVVDTYQIPGVVVCDLLNSDMTSLYGTYTAWISIPTGERLSYIRNRLTVNTVLADKLKPVYICIKLTNAQCKELGDLAADNITVTCSLLDEMDTDTEGKAIFAAEARAIQSTITQAIALNAEGMEAAGNE